MKHLLFLDFESAYDSKAKFDLRHTSIVQYVRDDRFKAFGMGVCGLTDDPKWITAAAIPAWLTACARAHGGWSNIAVVGHNVKFDGFILHEIYEVVPGQYIDTKGMSKAVLGKTVKGHSLQNLCDHYKLTRTGVTDGTFGKGEMKTDGLMNLTAAQEAELADYCLGDVQLTRDLFLALAHEGFPENQYAALHRTVDMFVNPKMQLNVALLEETSKVEAARRTKIFQEIGIEKKEFASNVKFPKLLESRGFAVPEKPSPRKLQQNETTGKLEPVMIPALALGDPEFLELLESPNEELRSLCEARVAAKSTLLETRSAKLAAIGRTGRWPFDIEFSGADQTHRFSGGKGAGGNPQNFTRGSALRTAVEAPPRYELVVGDFANIELRIVAYLSRDPGLVQAIEQGTDIYCDFASVFFGRKITRADKKERQFGKTAILGLGYGMGWKKFKRTVRLQTGDTITDEDAKKAVDLYRTRYGGVKALWDALDNTIQVMTMPAGDGGRQFTNLPVKFGRECIVLPSGLKIRYPNLRSVPSKDFKGQLEWVYDAYNKGHVETRKLYGGKICENISQALAGELCKESMMRVQNVVLQVHDELGVLCKRGLGFITQQHLKRAMTISPKWLSQIKLGAEVNVGRNWNAAK